MLSRLVPALLVALPAFALAGPMPPCGTDPTPPFGVLNGPPRAGIWTADELHKEGWRPAACLNWSGESKLVTAVASRFSAGHDVASRLGTVSAWPDIRYWSLSKQRWLPLVLAASAVDAAGHRLGDVPLAGLAAGRDSLFVESDENTGEATYRMRVLERGNGRIVVATENVTPIKISVLTAFEPGALQTVTFVTRETGSDWSTYQITRVGSGGSSLVLGHKGSFLNRLEAVRRHLAGRATDQDPPLAAR